MNTHEMEGFLRGQCVPRDLLVNESNAAYLVRKLSEIASVKAERDALAQRVEMLAHNLGNAIWGEQEALQRVNALAVENQALSAALSLISGSYGLSPHIQSMCAVDAPTTDSALAAIHAQGVEKFAAYLWKRGNEIVSEGGKRSEVIQVRVAAKMAEMFAEEMREAK